MKRFTFKRLGVFTLLNLAFLSCLAQHSVARKWNEVLLEAIRNDYARPTVHARNLFHISAAMYDCWTLYGDTGRTYLIGNTQHGFDSPINDIPTANDIDSARGVAISYAAYRLLEHRFVNAPGYDHIAGLMDDLFDELNLDRQITSSDYSDGNPAHLGNHIAQQYINYGMQDGANESGSYNNLFYEPINDSLVPELPGNPNLSDPNRWQPLTLDVFIDQSGNVLSGKTPDFLSPEWGKVNPFSLNETQRSVLSRDGHTFNVYHDPGAPVYLDMNNDTDISSYYKWGNALVSIWSSQLDPADSVMWDISPASIGNIQHYPTSPADYETFYDLDNGGDASIGHDMNPYTNEPYEPQLVPRADYARVLAEFWADGPDSETPPGHWFTILNYVNDHAAFEKRFRGIGPILNELEWDVKAYFCLAGTMHDAAISAWSIKGYYDYIRPISAIRYMCDLGQSTYPDSLSYHLAGIPLKEGYIEVVKPGDALSGLDNEHIGKIKVFAWRGPDFISNPANDIAGVGWILAENWWPYQRPTFITPPFAGYVSGHSVYSRAAAEMMTLLTGDAFFPGGMGEFEAKKNEFLVFEDGPSMDITLQWATYRDASDQTSLSRIWGGIHPPIDDLPGRHIGAEIGVQSFETAEKYFQDLVNSVTVKENSEDDGIYPNPIRVGQTIKIKYNENLICNKIRLINLLGNTIIEEVEMARTQNELLIATDNFSKGIYLIEVISNKGIQCHKIEISE